MCGRYLTRGRHAQHILCALLISLLPAVFLPLSWTAQAETATAEEMETVCRNWLSCVVHEQGSWAGEANPTIRHIQDIEIDGIALARCYSIFPQGHVVVPVLKELPPVKVSSQTCDLDVTAEGGPALLLREVFRIHAQNFIETYGSLEATQPRDGEALLGRRHRELWNHFLIDPDRYSAELDQGTSTPRTQVGPLLSSSWHQAEPYNNYCPMGDGGRCVVGCMATAVAQIMRYHEWPPKGIGGHSYYWYGDDSCGGSTEGQWIGADFSDPYDWENMPDNCMAFACEPRHDDALAELCFEVGVAFDMWYGHCFSAPANDDVNGFMSSNFRYDPSIVQKTRGDYSLEGWFAEIQEEINNDRPNLYTYLWSYRGGHAIVCDGWRDTGGEYQYHMNFGWGGGPYDAWYALDDLYNEYNPMENVMTCHIMPGSGFVFQVQPDGGGHYPTIQSAIDDVLDYDIVELVDGVFSGEGNRDVDFHGRPITVRSESGDPATCIIDCQGDPEDHRGFNFVSGEDSLSILKGITITNGFVAAGGGAILCANNSSPTIRNCRIRANAVPSGGGGVYCSGASPTLNRCVLSFNSAGSEGGAVAILDGAQPAITECTFYANAATGNGGGALWISADSHADVDNCIIAFGTGGGAIGCEGGSPTATLECCDLYSNAGGDWEGCIADQLGVAGNISEDPLFCDQENENFRLQTESPCGPDHNPSCGQIGAFPLGCALHVIAPDGTGDFPTIQAAIDVAMEGDTIELIDGTYSGEGNRDIDYCGKAVTVRSQGGQPELCVIDCQGTPEEVHRAFQFRSGETPGSVLQGIAIINGYTRSYSGGAIWCSDESSPTIDHCIFRDNYTGVSGGAIYCSGGSDPTISYCTFHDNTAESGGGIHFYNSEPVITNCTFAHNTATAHGGGISCMSSAPSVQNTIVAFSTDGEGVYCYSGSIDMSCCDVYGNLYGDWIDCIAGQEDTNGNICQDPMFCHPPSGNYRLIDGSPCAPFSPPNEECDLIGAWPVDCNVESIDGDLLHVKALYLAPNAPNPFAGSTRITYAIPSSAGRAPVRLSVFDPAGRLVRTLIDGDRSPGVHEAVWDGRTDTGTEVSGGIYFYQIRVNGQKLTSRGTLVR